MAGHISEKQMRAYQCNVGPYLKNSGERERCLLEKELLMESGHLENTVFTFLASEVLRNSL